MSLKVNIKSESLDLGGVAGRFVLVGAGVAVGLDLGGVAGRFVLVGTGVTVGAAPTDGATGVF